MPDLKVVELFCGIGGFHQGMIRAQNDLKGYPTEIEFKILSATDINNNATSVYKLNHPKIEKICKNGDINNLSWETTAGYNTVVMSPPCQPFTRNGKQLDSEDSRTKPLLSIIEKLRTTKKKNLPRYLVLENVKFFERSDTCKMLLAALKSRGFIYRQFLVSPNDLGIPNQRARYFLIAKRGKMMKFNFDSYVKNWKRKKTEPQAKKQKLDTAASDNVDSENAETANVESENAETKNAETENSENENVNDENSKAENAENDTIESEPIEIESEEEEILESLKKSEPGKCSHIVLLV